MKRIGLILLSCLTISTYSQDNPLADSCSALFYSFNEFRDLSSTKCVDLVVYKKTNLSKKQGMSEYKINLKDKSIKKKEVNKIVWGMYYKNHFYYNTYPYFGIKGYAKLDKINELSCFEIIPPLTNDQQENISDAAAVGGLLGGAVGAGIAAGITASKYSNRKDSYLIDKDGEIYPLTVERMRYLLMNDKELYEQYFSEVEYESFNVKRKYIWILTNN